MKYGLIASWSCYFQQGKPVMVMEASGNRKWVNSSSGDRVPVIRTDEEYDWAGSNTADGAAAANEAVARLGSGGRVFRTAEVVKLVEELAPDYKNAPRHIRTYLVNRGFIKRSGAGWRLTEEGARRAQKSR
jgi:hypothetical protein